MGKSGKIYSLQQLGLLKTSSHLELDNLTELVCLTMEAPGALITIVLPDEDRQYIISQSGVSEIQDEARCRPLQYSVSKHVRDANAPISFPDAKNEPLLADNPSIDILGIGSYLGVPIHKTNETAIGALCCIAHEPRKWSKKEIQILSKFSRFVDAHIRTIIINLEQKRANSELEKFAKSRAGFLMHMSHELRTPLTGVIGASKLLASLHLDGRAGELVSLLERTSSRLMDMVDDTLDLSKIDAGHIELDEFECNIKELIGGAVEIFRQIARDKNIDLSFDYEIDQQIFMVDRKCLGSVINNLVSNAIKFTNNGYVRVSVRPYDREGIFICVSDTGIGIAPARHKAIFDEFEQENQNNSYRFGGTGLGLAIVKRQVDLMGGNIEIISAPEKGTSFRVLLPLKLVDGLHLTGAT